MTWDLRKTKKIETELSEALKRFKWSEAEKICGDLVTQIVQSNEPYPENSARGLLSALRGKQCYELMSSLAEAFISSGADYLQIRRQYAQSLIDRGILTGETEAVLHSIIEDSQNSENKKIKYENYEARGLLGRMYKQIYVNSDKPDVVSMQNAFDAYYGVYKEDQSKTWHGINSVALIKRAQRDGIDLEGAPNPNILAVQIIEFIDETEKKNIAEREDLTDEELENFPKDPLAAWDIATKIEALIATGDYQLAEELALRYIEHERSDAFELNSTLRQLREVWKLTDENSPGSDLLSLLTAAHLQKRGASTTISIRDVAEEQKRVLDAYDHLQAKFGNSKTRTLLWVNTMLERCKSIARIEKLDGTGHGTGWLVNGNDFFPDVDGQLMVLTNYHVVSPSPRFPLAILPDQAQVRFEFYNEVFEIECIYWHSPYKEFDATFLILKKKDNRKPTAEPLPLFNDEVIFGTPPPSSLFLIGHPGGRSLEFSLEDNLFVASNDKYLHYRTPSEKGSSGSPVFDDVNWQVVALHHAGKATMKRLDNPDEIYEANEGIKIRSIREKTMLYSPTESDDCFDMMRLREKVERGN